MSAPDPAALARWLEVSDVEVLGGPTSGGHSGETVFLRADGVALVLRRAAARQGMFAHDDLGLQVRCLRHIHAHGLPAPEVVAVDLDGRWLGRPAYVMRRMSGQVPGDGRPRFTQAGFLHDATPAQQRTYGEHLVDCIADLHRLPPLAGLPIGPSTLDHLRWCADQRSGLPRSAGRELLDDAERRLRATLPPDTEPVLLWGDARPANTVVDDSFHVAAMLDWELAATGAPEFDIAWLNEMNRMRAAGSLDPVLPGLPTQSEVWRRWTARTGRTPSVPGWYRLYSAYRITLLMGLHLAERVRRGALAPDDPLHSANRATRRLAALLHTEDSEADDPTDVLPGDHVGVGLVDLVE
ncbi:phosphotransferase family protein [Pseudonocardia spinosispora]|uniref:phosphotransferase family protein n=1 Tax=Pseudonocardia spinosispora TaxID=103441 RepID=UPI00048C236D|nr:phosphotransferase family protein [Pseudonocardia spinosispora]